MKKEAQRNTSGFLYSTQFPEIYIGIYELIADFIQLID